MIVNLYGPSKTGKSVLSRQLLAKRHPIELHGSELNLVPPERNFDRFWSLLAGSLGIAVREKVAEGQHINSSLETKRKSKIGVAVGPISGGIGQIRTEETEKANSVERQREFEPDTRQAVSKELASRMSPIIIDDFHRLDRSVKAYILSCLRPILDAGASLVCISIPEEVERLISSAQPEEMIGDLLGRAKPLKVSNWEREYLLSIARRGFDALNLSVDEDVVKALYRHSYKNPMLMQLYCWLLCVGEQIEATAPALRQLDVGSVRLRSVFEESIKGFAAPCDRLLGRGGHRWKLESGKSVNLFGLILLAIVDIQIDQPIGIDTIMRKIARLTRKGELPPTRSEIVDGAGLLTKELSKGNDVPLHFDAQEQSLYIVQPYFKALLYWHVEPRFSGVAPAV